MQNTNEGLILFVRIKGSLNKAKKGEESARKTVRDMTVQYWALSEKTAGKVVKVVGVYGNTIYSAFSVKTDVKKPVYKIDCFTYPKNKRNKKEQPPRETLRYGFVCGELEEKYVGIRIPWDRGGWIVKTLNLNNEKDYGCWGEIEKIANNHDGFEERYNKVVNDLKDKNGNIIPFDNKDMKTSRYPDPEDFSSPDYNYPRNHKIVVEARDRANNCCELYTSGHKCEFCEDHLAKGNLDIHHILELHEDAEHNDVINNLIAICTKYHHYYHKYITKNPEEKQREIKRFSDVRKLLDKGKVEGTI